MRDAPRPTAAFAGVPGHRRQNPVEIDELEWLPIDPLRPYVGDQDTVECAQGISDLPARRQLKESFPGTRFVQTRQDKVDAQHSDLISMWHTFRDVRAA